MQNIGCPTEFCLGKASTHIHNTAHCKVVINSKDPYSVEYPAPAPVIERSADVFQASIEFYQTLSSTFAHILKTNNPKMIANLLDSSGEIIVGIEDLVRLISDITRSDVNTITLIYDSIETSGCFAKINPLKSIRNIKIGNLDFRLAFNAEYNILHDVYSVCLTKTLMAI